MVASSHSTPPPTDNVNFEGKMLLASGGIASRISAAGVCPVFEDDCRGSRGKRGNTVTRDVPLKWKEPRLNLTCQLSLLAVYFSVQLTPSYPPRSYIPAYRPSITRHRYLERPRKTSEYKSRRRVFGMCALLRHPQIEISLGSIIIHVSSFVGIRHKMRVSSFPPGPISQTRRRT